MKKTFSFLTTLIFFIFLASPVYSIGQVTKPIFIDGALREEEIQEMMYVINNEKKPQTIQIFADGEITDWVKFYDSRDKNTEINEVIIGSEGLAEIIALFKVPADVPNGAYSGILYAMQKPSEGDQDNEGSQATVLQKIGRDVSIVVSDEEKIALNASIIPQSFDIDRDENIDVRLIYDNQSNISLEPKIDLKIKDVDRKVVYNIIYPFPATEEKIKPGEIREIQSLSIPTGDLKRGKYLAQMDFMNGDDTVMTKDFNFNYDISKGFVLGASITSIKFFWPVFFGILVLSIIFVSILKKMRIISRRRILKK